MSLVLNMVGGGGSFTATDAILRVQAPSLSTVTISKGGVTKSDQGHENKDRPTIYDYYFIIHQSQFDSVNAWTVMATRGTESNSTTIIINASDEYNVSIGYHVPIQTYQEVEYLEGTGTQYILAGLSSSNANGYEIDYQFTQLYSGNNFYGAFGARYTPSTAYFDVSHWQSTIGLHPSAYAYEIDLTRHLAKTGAGFDWVTTFDGNVVATTRYDPLPTNVDNIAVFAVRQRVSNGTSTIGIAKVKIFSLKIYLDTTIKREFYPCYRLVDSVAGLYDKANNVFYTNSGSGTFTVGADV